MIQINYRDGRPFYEQIKENIRRLITSGVLVPDEKLPSVRELAAQLAINPNTIQRAYRELELEGYAYKVSGRGTFVAAVEEEESPRKKELLAQFDNIVGELLFLSVSEQELTDRIRAAGGRPGNRQEAANDRHQDGMNTLDEEVTSS